MADRSSEQLTARDALVRLMTARKQAYSIVFGSRSVPSERDVVWEDLARFCRDRESCFHADARIHAALEGRREVMLRIRDYVELSIEQLCRKYGRE